MQKSIVLEHLERFREIKENQKTIRDNSITI